MSDARNVAPQPTIDPVPPARGETDYTVVLTSCARFDLLRLTVQSLLANLDEPPAAFVIVEDSGDDAVRAAVADLEPRLDRPFTFLVNPEQLGQMRSIDRAYAVVETPYIFHCEDDWAFTRAGFIAASRAILEARPDVSMVGLRPRAELNPLVRETPSETLPDRPEIAFMALDPAAHPEYFSFSFNPGLRRRVDAERIGPFAPIGREEDVSYAYKRAGFRIANLEPPATRHIGDERHVHDPTSRRKPRTLLERLARSARKRIKRARRGVLGDVRD